MTTAMMTVFSAMNINDNRNMFVQRFVRILMLNNAMNMASHVTLKLNNAIIPLEVEPGAENLADFANLCKGLPSHAILTVSA